MADATADIKIIVKDVAGVVRSIDRVEKKLQAMGRSSAAASRQMVAANKTAAMSFDNMQKSISKVTGRLTFLVGGFVALGVAVREISKIQAIQLQLKAVSDGAEGFAKNLELVRAVSLETGTSFKENATLLTRYTRALQRFGGDAEHAAVVIDTLNKAFLVNGTTGSEATSVLVQLSQALTAGALSGDEFRSFAENAGSLVDALADTMNVSVTDLKKLGAQGKITADILIETAIRMNKEFSDAFEATGSLPLALALQNIVTEFEYAVTKSEVLGETFNQLGGYVVKLSELFIQLIGFIESLSFSNANSEVEGSISLWALFGEVVYKTITVVLTGVKLLVRGIQAAFQVVGYLIGSVIRNFTFMADTIVSVFDLASTSLDNLNKKANNPFTFELGAAQTDAVSKFADNVKNSFNRIEKIGDDAFSSLASNLGETRDELLDDLFSGVATALGEGSTGIKDGIIASLRDSLSALNSPKAANEIDKAAKKLGDDFAKAMADALRAANDAQAQLTVLRDTGSLEMLEQKKQELDIEKQLAEWRSKGVGEAALSAYRALLKLGNEQTDQLDKKIERTRKLADLNEEYARMLEGLDSANFALRNYDPAKSEQQLKYEQAIFQIQQEAAKLRAEGFDEQAARMEATAYETLQVNEQLQYTVDLFESLKQFGEEWGSAVGDVFGRIITGAEDANEAVKDLLESIIQAIARAAILSAFGQGTFSGNLFGTNAAAAGMSAGPTIRIYNQGGGLVNTSRRSNGDTDVILNQMATAISRGGNQFDKALQRTYGIGRKGV